MELVVHDGSPASLAFHARQTIREHEAAHAAAAIACGFSFTEIDVSRPAPGVLGHVLGLHRAVAPMPEDYARSESDWMTFQAQRESRDLAVILRAGAWCSRAAWSSNTAHFPKWRARRRLARRNGAEPRPAALKLHR